MNPWVRVAIEETTLCNRGAVLPNYGLELKGLETWKGTQPCGGAREDQILFYLTFLLLLIFHSTGVSFICLRTIVCPCLRPASFARFIQLVRPWQTTTRVPYVPRAKISSKSVIFSHPYTPFISHFSCSFSGSPLRPILRPQPPPRRSFPANSTTHFYRASTCRAIG